MKVFYRKLGKHSISLSISAFVRLHVCLWGTIKCAYRWPSIYLSDLNFLKLHNIRKTVRSPRRRSNSINESMKGHDTIQIVYGFMMS